MAMFLLLWQSAQQLKRVLGQTNGFLSIITSLLLKFAMSFLSWMRTCDEFIHLPG